jgi:GNAT superfamily N-acetyltransferase
LEDPVIEAEREGYTLSTDLSRLDLAAIHRFLSASYWSPGLPREVLTRAIAGSLCFGLYDDRQQVGFARVITDRATFAYLCDVYVLEAHRGRGLGRWIMEMVAAHPSLQGLRRFVLVTRDAHGLYARYGFRPLASPESYMELHRPDAYAQAPRQGEPRNGVGCP